MEPVVDEAPADELVIDEAGVDRTLVREMLALTPAERLARLEDFIDAVLAIRSLNVSAP